MWNDQMTVSSSKEPYNWKASMTDALKNGLAKSRFFEKLLLWATGEEKYMEVRRRYFKIFLESRINKTTYAILAAQEGVTTGRIGAITYKFECKIRQLIADANKRSPEPLEHISLNEFLQQLNMFYHVFVREIDGE